MKLTDHFTLEELTDTATKLPNKPGDVELDNLKKLAENVLEPARKMLDMPITVNSGFRSISVNISVGGSKTSQHVKGEAVDLDCDDNAKLFNIIRNELEFDQLIWEAGNDKQPAWVHVSYCEGKNRKQVLRMKNNQYTRM